MTRLRTLHIRRGTDADLPAILALLADSLGWRRDEQHEALFTWKHRANPFGPSMMWLGFDGGRLIGLRTLVRWQFVHAGRVQRAVRAVDTATHPDYQGQGIFTRLTLHALEELEHDDVAFVFNTPNDQSRPGYLKMGWQVVGRLPVVVRPTSPVGLAKMVSARTAAERWSIPTSTGVAAEEALADRGALERLLKSRPPSPGMATNVSADFLIWRYASHPIDYRAVVARDGPHAGLVIFRVRRRGRSRELVLCDVIAEGGDEQREQDLIRRLTREADANHLIALDRRVVSRTGFVRLPRQGPLLTSKPIKGGALQPLREWNLTLGDVEVF